MKLIKRYLIFIIILIVAFFMRFYGLGEIPSGLSQDETSLGYNAYSILKTGKDEYGQSYPVNFKAFGEYKLPGYIYLSVPSIALFGSSSLGIRFPSALFGFMTVVLLYFFSKKLTRNNNLSLLTASFLALNPWHIHFSRAAFEVVPALFFILMGSYLFILFSESKKYLYIILSGVFFIFSIYTYNICRLLAPLLFLILFYIYRKDINFKSKKLWMSGISSFILLLPYLFTFLSDQGVGSTQGTLLHSSAVVQARLLEERSAIVMQNPILAKLFFNKWALTIFEYLRNIASYLSASFLFITGSDHPNHGIGRMGMFYLFEIITFAMGAYVFVRKQEKWMKLLFLWAGLSILIASFTREAPHGTRGFFLIVPLVAISAYGMFQLFFMLSKNRSILRLPIILSFAVFIIFNLTYYFSSYYLRFPVANGIGWRSEDGELVDFIRQNEASYEQIIFDTDSAFIYTSLLYYLPVSPSEFQKNVIRESDDSEGFSKVTAFDKYKFEKVEWKNSGKEKKLIITSGKDIPDDHKILKVFYYPERPVVIADGQKILQFPTKDIAYMVIETN
jgi:4-amino-4-deoxy-L-arabinose transferase-like glycosyltransferase